MIFSNPDQDQDQNFFVKTKTIFCLRGVSRPRPWSRVLCHCTDCSSFFLKMYTLVQHKQAEICTKHMQHI